MTDLENQRNQATARKVADLLPEGWVHTPHPTHWAGIIDGPEGMRLLLGRNEIWGELPEDHGCYVPDEVHERRRIGVTLTREPKAIAREIIRRLLPGYTEAYREIAARAAEYRKLKEQSEALAEKARRLIPRDLIPKIETSGERVRVTLHLTDEQLDALSEGFARLEETA